MHVLAYSDNPCAEGEMKLNEEGFRFICSAMIMQFLVKCHVCHDGKKVKCTLVQALRLCTGHTTHRGSRGIDLL